MSLGFEQAGFDIVAAVEIDPVHCAAHMFNFPHCTVIPHSVVELSGQDIRTKAKIGTRRVDCVIGGAPCQGFSLIGQRVLDDPRNALARDFLRIVSELNAETFVFENVKGLTLGKHRKFLEEFVSCAEALGYKIRLPWQVLNAGRFGTPQNRQRLILFGSKSSAKLANYPAPWNRLPVDEDAQLAKLPLGPSVKEALSDLPDANSFADLKSGDSVKFQDAATPSRYALEMRCQDNDAWHFGYVRNWNPSILTSSARTAHSEISKRRFRETAPGQTEPISRFFKLAPDGLSNTLRAGTDGSRGAFTSPRPIHYKYPRCVTVREMARLHGYPDWFRFNKTKWHGARQIGNSVPPPLARAVGARVLSALKLTATRPFEIVDLGDASLLAMTVSSASKFFDVTAPCSRRDRKSGATKRSQIETERERLAMKEDA